jgi:hypothetical protein
MNGIKAAQFLAEAATGAGGFINAGYLATPEFLSLRIDRLQKQVQIGGVHIAIRHHFIACQGSETAGNAGLARAAFAAKHYDFFHAKPP